MSNKNLARRTDVSVSFAGVDISEEIRPYLLSLTYTDNEEDETDDLQIKLHDKDDIWLKKWLNDIIEAAATKYKVETVNKVVTTTKTVASSASGFRIGDVVTVTGRPYYTSYGTKPGGYVYQYRGKITHLNLRSGVPYPIHVGSLGWFSVAQVEQAGNTKIVTTTKNVTVQKKTSAIGLLIDAVIAAQNWSGDGVDDILPTGVFELDNVQTSGPPNVITIKATSLPYSSTMRKTKKSKAWENYNLSGIVAEMASKNRMSYMYLCDDDPFYPRVEQVKMTDISFLSTLCHNAGLSLKVTDNIIVLFDQATYEAKESVLTIKKGEGYSKYKLDIGEADTQYDYCRVRYIVPSTGKVITGYAYSEDYDEDADDNQRLDVSAAVASVVEAEVLAAKRLRLANKFAKSATFTLPGNVALVSGVTVDLEGFGAFSGRYIIKQAKHTVSDSGYTVQIKLRSVLE